MPDETNNGSDMKPASLQINGPMWALFAFVFLVTGIAVVVFWMR